MRTRNGRGGGRRSGVKMNGSEEHEGNQLVRQPTEEENGRQNNQHHSNSNESERKKDEESIGKPFNHYLWKERLSFTHLLINSIANSNSSCNMVLLLVLLLVLL